jgi:hypothetical protein
MSHRIRSYIAAAAAGMAFAALPGVILTFQAPGIASAGCVTVGRRVSVTQCGDPIGAYAPPPDYYAPLPDDPPPPPNVTGCVSYNGRWVGATNCP